MHNKKFRLVKGFSLPPHRKRINLRDYYSKLYRSACYTYVSRGVLNELKVGKRNDSTKDRNKRRGKILSIDYYDAIAGGQNAYKKDEWVSLHVESAEDACLRKLEHDLLNDALMQLQPNQRKLIIKRYYWGVSVTDLAKEQGITKQSMSEKIHRILKRLKIILVNPE